MKGQVCLLPLVEEGLLNAGVATTNVEAACASGSLAFGGAWKDILSGQSEISLAIGIEKMYEPGRRAEFFVRLEKGTDFLDTQDWIELYKKLASACGTRLEMSPERSIAMDIYALWAKTHLARYGTTECPIACAAAKNHTNSVGDPRAQYRFPMDTDGVLADRMVCEPLTRAMCAPIGDAAAAALLCSEDALRKIPGKVRGGARPRARRGWRAFPGVLGRRASSGAGRAGAEGYRGGRTSRCHILRGNTSHRGSWILSARAGRTIHSLGGDLSPWAGPGEPIGRISFEETSDWRHWSV